MRWLSLADGSRALGPGCWSSMNVIESTHAGARYRELDSLRGLAALIVVFQHFSLVYGVNAPSAGAPWVDWAAYRVWQFFPLHILIAGHEAVLLFFLLSGFVLALPYFRQAAPTYPRFLAKRFCRLYLPYAAALALACGANALLYGPVAGTSAWFQQTWATRPDLRSMLDHVGMIGSYDYSRYNTAFWSLVYEARISCIFPLIALAVSKLRVRALLTAAAGLSILGQVTVLHMANQDLGATLHYAALFILGAMGARYQAEIREWMNAHGKLFQGGLLLGALTMISLSQDFKNLPGVLRVLLLVTDWPAALAGMVVLVCAMNYEPFRRILLHRWSIYLGKISYSQYLTHATVLFTLVRLLHGRIAAPALLPIYLAAVVIFGAGFNWLVEEPSIRLGRRLGQVKKIAGKPAAEMA